MQTARIQARIAPHLKAAAEGVIREKGYTVSQVFTVFYAHIAEKRQLPIIVDEMKIPNKTTIEALRADKYGRGGTSYKSAEDGLKALGLIKSVHKNKKK